MGKNFIFRVTVAGELMDSQGYIEPESWSNLPSIQKQRGVIQHPLGKLEEVKVKIDFDPSRSFRTSPKNLNLLFIKKNEQYQLAHIEGLKKGEYKSVSLSYNEAANLLTQNKEVIEKDLKRVIQGGLEVNVERLGFLVEKITFVFTEDSIHINCNCFAHF